MSIGFSVEQATGDWRNRLSLRLGKSLRVGPTFVIAAIMVVIMAALMLPPLFILIQNSVTIANPNGSRGAFTLANYARILSTPNLYTSAWNTFQFAFYSTVMVLFVGGILA